MRHFEALLDLADETGLPERHVTDLDWDRLVLEETPEEQPFGFALRDMGTHLFMPGTQDGVGHTADMFPGFVRESFGGSGTLRFYWWDGQQLQPVSERKLTANLRAAANGYATESFPCAHFSKK
ncbi:MAG: hypothetical protein JRD89_03480 [Deltaproteobacteria bacterium]|nr:hypothetical protein [Deltaproteobacteria bacterium]